MTAPAEPPPPDPVQTSSQAAPAAEPEQPKGKGRINLGRFLKKNGPDFITMVPAKVVSSFGREPNEPDPDLMIELRECTDTICETRLPNMEINPWLALIFITLGLGFQMAWGAEKKAPAPTHGPKQPPTLAPVQRPADTSGSASSTDQTTAYQQSPSSSGQTPELSLVPLDGDAETAPPS